ncbi:MAG: hypothetical protein K1X56_14180 [Flavobacteriales bacterium]|nr:hypothetical protein [Flavobacteriales bacterium]
MDFKKYFFLFMLLNFGCNSKKSNILFLGTYCSSEGNCIELLDSNNYRQIFSQIPSDSNFKKFEYFQSDKENEIYGSIIFYDFIYLDSSLYESHLLKDPRNANKVGLIYDPLYKVSIKGENIPAIRLAFDRTDEIYILKRKNPIFNYYQKQTNVEQ